MGRICILLTGASWDDQRHFHKQAPALARDGHDVIFMANDPGRRVTDLFTMFALSTRQRRMARFSGALNLLPTVLQQRPAAVQVCCVEQLPLGLVLKLISRIKVIYDSREDMYHSMRDEIRRGPAWFRWILATCTRAIESLAATTFDGIIASDPAIYAIHRNMPVQRKALFYNSPPLSYFTRNYPPLAERPYDLTWLRGSGERPESYALFGEALRLLGQRGRNVRVLLIGDITALEEAVLNRASAAAGGRATIVSTGRIPYENVPEALRRVKIGLVILPDMPKLRNNIACKAFDYMASGMPVISADLPPQHLFIKPGETGLFFQPDDAAGLADAVARLLDHPQEAQEMGDAARRAVEEYWNCERDQEQLRRFYRKIVALPRRGQKSCRPPVAH